MSEFQKEFGVRKRTLLGWGLAGVVGLTVLVTAGAWLGAFGSVATAPARVITSTMRTDNIINNYEWFHDAHRNYEARVSQIAAHRSILKETTDTSEASRLRIEVASMQQACRELAGRYNANATKTNRSVFMGQTAPAELNTQRCE